MLLMSLTFASWGWTEFPPVSHRRESLLQDALEHRGKGEYDLAIENYQKLSKENPNDAKLIRELGVLYFETNNYQEALNSFGRSLELNPNDAETEYNLGQTYLGMNDLSRARSHFERACELKPEHLGATYGLGLVLDATGDPAAAQMFRKVIAKDPQMADAHFHLGSIYYGTNRYLEAENEFQQAVTLQPANISAYYNLGLARIQQEKWESAREAFKQMLEDSAMRPKALYQIAFSYEAQGFNEEAAQYYEEVILLDPSDLDAQEHLQALREHRSLPRDAVNEESADFSDGWQGGAPNQRTYDAMFPDPSYEAGYGQQESGMGGINDAKGALLQSGISMLTQMLSSKMGSKDE
ncbi:MAG: hypothetical protein A3G33_01680 [Omnitrophica bacterium RIFCSPLOWO2_12_FULL_44_17]|uniref:Uncharacterized protein n=1 Tax=Candidatus Danuiimicrobium aquiferis TaxID=1801832 RepID=A0A1G1KVB7_9BACT|nr:MAG: hypothetical protein A3B72_00915 [Omnitrophica bacterium RIFCSPHIGHO2_02_FULL_45_28]OGW88556.1 MAG: hypothetical protein A3E74_06560 [Omnitrophica bacterium RIFCSPHIGHO2_12_FULL_44_12]OGW96825.1 MAG: hypothetical protein A3G33_01680 [Omnitrophica bacterium RIFCSPLOWO2_12_FULL_44_17]OGX03827.1 MAG: hypothetical protein A3J12_09575 [Omnitrophica bacterium RIFCSPLOWO2_02_FULL_44_11]